MLRWHVGGLPVVEDDNRLVGIITYTDLLREFVGREEVPLTIPRRGVVQTEDSRPL